MPPEDVPVRRLRDERVLRGRRDDRHPGADREPAPDIEGGRGRTAREARAQRFGVRGRTSTTKRGPRKPENVVASIRRDRGRDAGAGIAPSGARGRRRGSADADSRDVAAETSVTVTFERNTYMRSRFATDSAISPGSSMAKPSAVAPRPRHRTKFASIRPLGELKLPYGTRLARAP